jgi:hypothetical protein
MRRKPKREKQSPIPFMPIESFARPAASRQYGFRGGFRTVFRLYSMIKKRVNPDAGSRASGREGPGPDPYEDRMNGGKLMNRGNKCKGLFPG